MEQRVSQHRQTPEARARIRSMPDSRTLIRGLATKRAGPGQDGVQDRVARQRPCAPRRIARPDR